ncbi:fimbrial protein [Providencia stuartii]|uniref:fimbrial protein n=1 Tax=Providencia TaxID=586 RepID=UPI0027F7ED49|nr:fimbrial protein [Providencia sp. 2023EL-00965]ELR5301008.1 fimbrial protein [Providencia stuartii]MDW7587915.1 fimbrial protein [Providencia sp. 2023EL-00965]
MFNLQKPRNQLLGLMGILSLFSASTQAIEVNFKGNLIDNPPCDVYDANGKNQPIKIDFGEIGITDIDELNVSHKGNYQQNFTLTVSCGAGLGNSVALFMEYKGVPANFYKGALWTSQTNLAIYLESDGTAVKPNDGLKVVMSSNGTKQIPFTATPIRNKGTMPLEGDFTASATVEMLYP